MQKIKYDQKVIFQNIRENELVIPHAIKVYRFCIEKKLHMHHWEALYCTNCLILVIVLDIF